MHLYMIRHGQSYINLKDWQGGNTDEPLTELGQQQAAALGTWIPNEIKHIDALYASTMVRAQETAVHVANAYDNVEIINDDRIREIGNNMLNHQPWPSDDLPEYGTMWGSEQPFSSITPERDLGESLMHFRVRVGSFIEGLIEKHRGETVVAVCHGGVIEVTLAHAFNIGPWGRCEVLSRNTGIAHFVYIEHPHREKWRMLYHNKTEHLVNLGKPPAHVELRRAP